MRIPHSALRSSVIIHDFAGNGALGPAFGDPRVVRASVQDLFKILITDVGEESTNQAMILIRPEDGPVPLESWIECEGLNYRVVKSFAMPDSFRPTHWEITLRRWAK